MGQLLYIQASPRGDRSYSVSAAHAFIDAYRSAHPDDMVTTLDVFERDLPPFDGFMLQAKYTVLHGASPTGEERAAWDQVTAIVDEFKAADRYLIATGMWNFSIPYRLKQYLDIIVQPGLTFTYSAERGYQGMVTGKPLALICARGGEYPPGTPGAALDFQRPYLETVLRFIGFEGIRTVVIEPTLMGGQEAAERARSSALARAAELGAEI
ncbi:MAG TPA: NAD(P)H-dependent oxidoreductase [Armatimonadota bacterium]|nr:NAD(P)H-dependent oxidoreductase [Armatimonadota bacterium]HQK94179.1 NAD(P)H-dependent oxidoreductase [Armatimonadota bacterium]